MAKCFKMPKAVFSNKESEIIRLISKGYNSHEIANTLGISVTAVSIDIEKISNKILGVDDSITLMRELGVLRDSREIELTTEGEQLLKIYECHQSLPRIEIAAKETEILTPKGELFSGGIKNKHSVNHLLSSFDNTIDDDLRRFKEPYFNQNVPVVIATLNEEEGIGPTISEMQSVLQNPYMIVVDGNSVDRTVEIAKNMGAHVLLQDGKGKGDAMFQGFRYIDPKVPYIVFTDADYTYPAEYIPKMVEILEENPTVGMVIGNRFKEHGIFPKKMTSSFLANKFLAFVQLVLNGVRVGDPTSGLRVVRSQVLYNWSPKSKGFDVDAEMNAIVERRGYKIVEIPIDYRDRMGEKKFKVRDGLKIMKRILAESLSI